MKKRKGIGTSAVAVGALVVIAFVAASQAGLLSAAGGGDKQADEDAVANLQLKAKDTMADSETFVGISYEVVNSDGQEVATGTLSSSSYTKVPDLDENSQYTVHVYDDDGSGSDYYWSSRKVTTSETSKYIDVKTRKEGSLSHTVFETDGTEDDGTISLNTGETETVTLELKESTADAASNNPTVFVKTNSSAAISDIEVTGGSKISSVPSRISSYENGYTIGVSSLEDYQTTQVDVQITRDDSNTDTATVKLLSADEAGFENDASEWLLGYEDSSDADVGHGDTTSTITVNN